MRSINCALKRRHAVYAGKLRAATLIAMRVEFLLGEDIATALQTAISIGTVHDLSWLFANLALERNHNPCYCMSGERNEKPVNECKGSDPVGQQQSSRTRASSRAVSVKASNSSGLMSSW